MAMREGLNKVADLVERVEVGGVAVEDVSLSRTDGDGLDVKLSVSLPSDSTDDGDTVGDAEASPAEVPGEIEPGADATAEPPDVGAHAVGVGRTLGGAHGAAASQATAGSDGDAPENAAEGSSDDERVACRVEGCDATFETEHGMKIHATKAHQSADGSAPSPHRDPDRLRTVYERHDTFDEMTEALGVDVTAQTVRRSMMALGIHDPADDADGGAGSTDEAVEEPADEDPAAEAEPATDEDPAPETEPSPGDGTEPRAQAEATPAESPDASAEDERQPADDDEDVSAEEARPADAADSPAPSRAELSAVLPDGVDPEVLVTAVQDASTLFQVQRALGMEREEVQHLLAELDLLELVHGRVATEDERDLDREEIERRILAAATDDADPGEDLDDGGEPIEAE